MERNLRKTRVGKVISDKMQKTVVVAIEDKFKHPLYKKIVKVIIVGNVEAMPVIKTCSLQLSVINLKAHGTYYVKSTAGRCAGTSDITCVLGYLGFVKDYIYLFHILKCLSMWI